MADRKENSQAPEKAPIVDDSTALEPSGEEEPTDQEKKELRHVGEWLNWSCWIVAIVEFCERFTYYGMQGLFQNYCGNPTDGTDGARGLGYSKSGATGLNTFFSFWCMDTNGYLTPLLGAVIADQYLGRYKTILIFTAVYMIGILILTLTSLPVAMAHGAARPGFIVAIIVIGLGTGGIKSNVAPLIADQYTRKKMAVKTLPSGERVVIDPAVTIQTIYMIFYLCINTGCLSLMATPFMEEKYGFWSAYLLCLFMFVFGTTLLVLCSRFYVVKPPQGTVVLDCFKIMGMMLKARNMDAAKPSYLVAHGSTQTVSWDDHFVDELKRALVACKVFCIYPIYWLCYSQFSTNFVAQAKQMNEHGIPNDFMQNFDPIAIITFVPVLDRIVYPALRKIHIQFRPITRITAGFIVAGLAIAYAAITQHFIYQAPPCYGKPKACSAGRKPTGEKIPNDIHIAIQTPAYIFMGISEIFASVTGLEYAYTKAPVNLKSFIQSLYLLTNAFGSALSEAFIGLVGDPQILWLFTGIAISAFIAATVIWVIFSKYNDTEEEMNEMGI